MPPGEDPADRKRGDKRAQHESGRRLMPGAADRDDEETKAAGGERSTEKVKGVLLARQPRQSLHADQESDDAKGQVDRKQPRPGPERKDARGDARPEREADCDDERIVTEAAAV